MTTDRCPTCDREACPSFALRDRPWSHAKVCADDDCHAHCVDWRAKFFAAESDAARWHNVAPLIERLRSFANGPTDLRELLTVAIDLVAATKEP